MRRRLYFVLPDSGTAQRVFRELLLARVEERHIQLLARDDSRLEDLPRADLWHRSDLVHGMAQGLFVGGLTGVIVGAAIVFMQPRGMVIGAGAVLGLAMLGAIFGSWVSGLIGFDVPNTQLRRFEPDLLEGRILLMVDIPRRRVHEIEELIHAHYPDAEDRGTEPIVPAFP
jgi:hypothetical protein